MNDEPRRHVLMFLPRFVAPIQAGTKTQTIRGRRKREVRPGDVLSLRRWVLRAYRSPQDVIVPDVVCLSVRPVEIRHYSHHSTLGIFLDEVSLDASNISLFAKADGFRDAKDFYEHWSTRPTPRGTEPGRDLVVIEWAPIGKEATCP